MEAGAQVSRFHQKLKPEDILKLAHASKLSQSIPAEQRAKALFIMLGKVTTWCSNNLVLVLDDCPLCGQSREDCEADPCVESRECCTECEQNPCTCEGDDGGGFKQ